MSIALNVSGDERPGLSTQSPVVLYARALEAHGGRFTWISDRVTSLLGYASTDWLEQDWWIDCIHPDDRAQTLGGWSALARAGRLVCEYRFRRRDGTYCWLHDEMEHVPAAAGAAAHCVGAWLELTERPAMADRVQQAVGQLAGGVAHDFNNLLTVINGFSDVLLSNLARHDPNRALVNEVRRAGERAAAMTRQLALLSCKPVAAPRVLDIDMLLRDLDKRLRTTLGAAIELATALHASRPVLADVGQLDQVVLTLVVNARDAMPDGGRLTIETRDVDLATLCDGIPPGRYVLLAVSDTGCGMTTDVQQRIFEPFFTTKGPHSNGLGLATVEHIVRQAGGHVAVQSEPGRGASFRIYLPWAQDDAHKGADVPALQPNTRGSETVLLVEDENAVRALVRHVLQNQGYTVIDAHDGPTALARCAEHMGTIDLLITDVMMPEMGGKELADAVHAIYPALRVLFLSGYTHEAVSDHGQGHEPVHFLQKPFLASVLTRTVRAVLDQRHEGV